MTDLQEKAKQHIIQKLTENKFKETVFKDNKSGDRIVVTPYGPVLDVDKLEDIEFLGVECPDSGMYEPGFNTIDELAKFLCEYNANVEEDLLDKDRLNKFYLKNIKPFLDENGKWDGKKGNSDDFQVYSDWYKSSYGRRPKL